MQTSPTSPKQYQITFYHGDPLLISESVYKHLSQEDDNGTMLIDRVKTIKLKGRIIRTGDISGIDQYRNHEEENRYRPPLVPANEKNLKLWAECKATFNACLRKKERFDPYKHFPKAWRDKLPPKDSYTYTDGDHSVAVSLTEKEYLDAGVAVIDWPHKPLDPYRPPKYPCVCINAARMAQYALQKKAQQYHVHDVLDQMILDAPEAA